MALKNRDTETIKNIFKKECNSLLKEYFAVSSLENIVYQIRWYLISGDGLLPELDVIKQRITQILNEETFRFIVERLRTYFCILNPVGFSNAPVKDLSILNRLDASFGDNKTQPYEDFLPQEIDKDLLILDINRVHPKLKDEHIIVQTSVNNRYFKALHSIIAKRASHFGLKLTEDFLLENLFAIPTLSRKKIFKLSEYLIEQGYIDRDDQQSFIGCFNNTINVPEKIIIWRDKNEKTQEPAVASLYCLFKTLGLKMTRDNRKYITSIFSLPNKAINETALKSRNSSIKLKKLEKEINAIIK